MMRLKSICLGAALAATLLLFACNAIDSKINTKAQKATSTPETTYADGARRVTITELETMVKEGKAVVIDVRSQDAYDAGHIPGAKLIPAADILKHLDELPKDKLIITYCS